MTTDGAALLRAILESPADDAPRLVYADWLEENGQSEMAEFVRGHVRRNLGPFANVPGRAITFAYSPEINFYVQAGESGPVVVVPATPDVQWSVSRGFVASVSLPTAAFLEHAPALFAAHPITAVRLVDKRPHLIHDPEDGLCFFTDSGDEPNPPHGLPPEIVIAMRGRRSSPDCPWDSAILFDSLQEATEAISAACVSYGRSLAGLPPLSPREAVEEVARV